MSLGIEKTATKRCDILRRKAPNKAGVVSGTTTFARNLQCIPLLSVGMETAQRYTVDKPLTKRTTVLFGEKCGEVLHGDLLKYDGKAFPIVGLGHFPADLVRGQRAFTEIVVEVVHVGD